MARQKSSSNNSGCATCFGIMMILGLFYEIVSKAIAALMGDSEGAKTGLSFFGVFVIVWLIWKVFFYLTHRKPLTYDQARTLAKSNAKKYIKRQYRFKKINASVNPLFKSNLDRTGRWYDIKEPIDMFPSYIAALLKGKHHEWVVIAIEKDGLVCSMWANKGIDNKSVCFNCDIQDIVRKCRQIGGYTILRFHNHPNSDPRNFNLLVASEQDKRSAKYCSEIVCKEGFNWYDFVCERGGFLKFYSQISDAFEVRGESTSDIIDKNAICSKMNYDLQKQYRKTGGAWSVVKSLLLFGGLLVVTTVLFGLSESSPYSENPSLRGGQIASEEKSGDWITAELEDFEYEFQHEGIILGKYNGSAKNVIIPSSYEVEGDMLKVLKLQSTFESNRRIENIIISEGIGTLEHDSFYKCPNVKNIYIPASVSGIDSAIEEVEGEALYYGGSEEQWEKDTYINWSEIGFKRVYFNSKMEECYENKDTVIEDNPDNTESGCAPLSDFEYDLVDGGIVLNNYIGRDKSVKISAKYYINGEEHPVVSLDTTFALASVNTVCVPEGVTTLEPATFNSCGIEKLYLPSTLQDVEGYFWSYFHDMDTLYYGGTEEEFKKLLGDSQNRWDIDVKHVEYEASPEEVFR